MVGGGPVRAESEAALLRLMLDSHPELAIPPETHFIPRLVEASPDRITTADSFSRALAGERRWADFGLDGAELADRIGAGEVVLDEALRRVNGSSGRFSRPS